MIKNGVCCWNFNITVNELQLLSSTATDNHKGFVVSNLDNLEKYVPKNHRKMIIISIFHYYGNKSKCPDKNELANETI